MTIDIEELVGVFPYNPLFFLLRGPDNVEYHNDLEAQLDAPLQAGNLPAGQMVHGKVGFAAPASVLHGGAVLFTIVYDPIAYWTMN